MRVLADVDIKQFVSEGQKVMLYFTADWCEPCKKYGPLLKDWVGKHPDIRFYSVDVAQNPKLASAYEVMSLPTTILFRHKEVPRVIVGTATEDRLENYMGL